jgi:hypothetical protein
LSASTVSGATAIRQLLTGEHRKFHLFEQIEIFGNFFNPFPIGGRELIYKQLRMPFHMQCGEVSKILPVNMPVNSVRYFIQRYDPSGFEIGAYLRALRNDHLLLGKVGHSLGVVSRPLCLSSQASWTRLCLYGLCCFLGGVLFWHTLQLSFQRMLKSTTA